MKIAEVFVEYLTRHRLQLTTAESCTAGMIMALTADIEGCGEVIDCGYVVYSVDAKKRLLGVSQHTIDAHTLSSEEVAREMAAGALRAGSANAVIATTGIAGPEPMDGIPAGTVCFAWGFAGANSSESENAEFFSGTEHFDGGREQVRTLAAQYAMKKFMQLHDSRRLLA